MYLGIDYICLYAMSIFRLEAMPKASHNRPCVSAWRWLQVVVEFGRNWPTKGRRRRVSGVSLRCEETALVTGACAVVSGATGFLGGRLAVLLRDRGFRVRALARRTSDTRRLVEAGIDIVEGDVTDPASLTSAMAGARVVFHTAGKVTDWAPRHEFFRANVTGTANVVSACRSAGVRRLVHVSSLTVLGLPRSGETVTEDTPPAHSVDDAYSQSKMEGERLVLAADGVGGLSTTVVRPGAIWGKGDVTIVPRIVALLRQRRMVLVGSGANVIGLVHVDNMAEALLLAAQAPAAAGQVYHVTDGEEITAREAIDALAAAAGVPPPRVALPFAVVFSVAALVEVAARLSGRTSPPALTRYGVRFVACDNRYDISKARRELGYRPSVTFRAGVAALGLATEGTTA